MRLRFALLAGFASVAQVNAQAALPDHPPAGRMIDIGGRKLHLLCSGKGSPTVVLVAGGGAYSIDWALVQPRVAETTRVCSYDRAGLAGTGRRNRRADDRRSAPAPAGGGRALPLPDGGRVDRRHLLARVPACLSGGGGGSCLHQFRSSRRAPRKGQGWPHLGLVGR